MPTLTCLFIVQGEGRGHLTQALAVREALVEAGHRVGGVLVGHCGQRRLPGFFLEKIGAPVRYFPSPTFVRDGGNRVVRPVQTGMASLRRVPQFQESLLRIDRAVRCYRPDVLINFYEPMAGLYNAFYRPGIPMVCIAHQYVFLHPAHRFPAGHYAGRKALRFFTRLTALGATRVLALSLYPVAPSTCGKVTTMPPLLRRELFRQPGAPQEPFLLAYVLNDGYAEEIIRWHQRHPSIPLHCFWDRQGVAAVEPYDATLTFHQLDDAAFLSMMARCRALITTAGFESIAEAMYLGKPVLAVPVKGHFEQYCNSTDVVKAGAGISSDHFAIDALMRFLPSYQSPAPTFRAWLAGSTRRCVREIEAAAGVRARPAKEPNAGRVVV